MAEPEGTIREPAAKTARAWEALKAKWRRDWVEGTRGRHLFTLALQVIHRHLELHQNRKKAHSALLTQLRTGKIGLNQFLHERNVPGYASGNCECGKGAITVRYILLTCPRWREEREELLERSGSTL